MASITTDQYLDNGTARTAGESWTINSCTLTVRTDTRWHANAPASMTGTIGLITSTNQDIGFYVDGTKVRWMAFDTGTGNVPAIGTTVTQGGVSGYLLGVWASLTSAPTAVGAAMPSSGFLKFREVTSGPYAAGALTGIGANATSPDVVGWIEVVRDTSSSMGGGRLGLGYKVQGDWFQLGTTTGSINQTIQLPTNGGGAGTIPLGVQIETSPGSGVFEWYSAVDSTRWLTTTLTTDSRAKLVACEANGVMRIGSNSAGTAIGYLPVAGCAIRTPNVFLRQALAASRASNNLPATTAARATFGAGYCNYKLDKVSCDWFITLSNSFTLDINNTILIDGVNITNPSQAFSIANTAICNALGTTANPLYFTSVKVGGTISNVVCLYTAGSGINLDLSSGITFTNVKCIFLPVSQTAFANGVTTPGGPCSSCTFTNLSLYACIVNMSNVKQFTFTNTDYIERMAGPTTVTNGGAQIFYFPGGAEDILIDGLTFGQGGALANCHPYATSAIAVFVSVIGGIRVRNWGTAASPLNVGSTSTIYPASIISMSSTTGTKVNKFQRLFVANTRQPPIVFNNGCANVIYEQIGYSSSAGSNPGSTDAFYRGMMVNAPLSAVNSLGSMWYDSFPTTTTGKVVMEGSDPRSFYSAYVTTNFTTASSGFGASSCKLSSTSDYFISDTPYFIKGHTAFANIAPVVNATGGHTITYQIDTGSGWNGTYKAATAANLITETIDPTTGFKLKIKVQPTGNSTINQFINIVISTVSTATAQQANLYPLDTNTLGFTNLVAGSEVRVYAGTDPSTATEIGGTESSGTTFSFSHSSGGVAGVIAIFAMGYQPIYLPYTFKSTDDSILIQQVVDRNYVNPI